MPQICIFDRVKLKNGQEGEVQFIGQVEGKECIYYGIKLDENTGDNNGSYNCIKYFDCPYNYGKFITLDEIIDYQSTKVNQSFPRVSIGDKVYIKNKCEEGILRFVGTTHFEQGCIYGIELLTPLGDNNGCIDGRQYFKCNDYCGTFCQSNNIKLLCKKHAFPIPPKTKETLQNIWNSYNRKIMSKIYHVIYECVTNNMSLVNQVSNVIISYLFGDTYTNKYGDKYTNKKQKLNPNPNDEINEPQPKRRRLTEEKLQEPMEESDDTDDEDIYGPYPNRDSMIYNKDLVNLEASKWKNATDKCTGQIYWYHMDTKQTTWNIPPCVAKLLDCDQQNQNNMFTINNNPYCDVNLISAIQNYSPNANQQFIGRHSVEQKVGKLCKQNSYVICRDERTCQHDRYWQIGSRNEYKMEIWARYNYEIELHKKGLFAIKHQNICDILSYIEFNKMKNPLNIKANYNKRIKEQCMQVWKNINSYMGLRKSRKSSQGHIDKLLDYAINGCDILRDEMYCQIIKQVTKNPKLSSVINGYKLLLICCSFFIPTQLFTPYLACFLWNNTHQLKEVGMYAIKALHALDNTVVNGVAKTIPLPLQIWQLENLED